MWGFKQLYLLVNDQRDAQILFYVFISIYNSLHVSSTSCSSSGETNFINTASVNSHSMLVIYQESLHDAGQQNVKLYLNISEVDTRSYELFYLTMTDITSQNIDLSS